MSASDLGALIGTVGFPIAVAVYVLVRLETTMKQSLDKLTAAVDKLREAVIDDVRVKTPHGGRWTDQPNKR